MKATRRDFLKAAAVTSGLMMTGVPAIAVAETKPKQAQGEDLLVFVSAFAPGEKGAIHACHLDMDAGELKQVHRTAGMENPFFLALASDGKFLYSVHAPGKFGGESHEQVAAYEILGNGGQLRLLNRRSTLGSATCSLAVDATGRALVAANYLSGSVVSLPIRKDGSLGFAVSLMRHEGSSVNPDRQESPHAHCVVIGPDGRFVYAVDLGMDKVLGYELDAATARISTCKEPFAVAAPGAGPRHLTFHPNGRHVYVINELSNSITFYDRVSTSGALRERQTISTLPKGFVGTSHCADLKVTPDGRFLFGTNRGHDSIAAYRIGDDGRLTLAGIVPSLGKGPQNLAITPGGKFLLCANMPSNNVVVFRIDARTGQLTHVGDPLSIPSPTCIMVR